MIRVWIAFIAFVLPMLALDLGVSHRKAHVVTVREALAWSAVWLSLGLAFAVFVYFAYEGQWFGLGAVADAVDGLPNDGSTALVLMVVGVKMLLVEWLKLALGKHFNLYLLTVVLSILVAGVAASVFVERRRMSRPTNG